MTRFKDKICVVRRLASEGGAVMLLDVRYGDAEAAAERLGQLGGYVEAYACDVASEQQVAETFAKIEATHGRLDVLVNNAGIGGPGGPLEDVALSDWRALLAVNLDGVFLCTREALRRMKKTGGAIVNVSSIYGLVGSADSAAYHASKGAVRLLTKATALQVARLGIRVNSVHPGFIDTPLIQEYAEHSGHRAETLEALAALHPVGRLGRAEEVAAVIAFLASDDASFMTGAEVAVDGGFTAQ